MLSALAAAFLCESSSRTSFPQLQQWLGFFWPWPTYAGPQFCSIFTGGNNTYLPHRHGVRLSFIIACKMLWDSLEEDAVWKEMHKEIHQLSLKIRDVEAPQGCKFGWNLTKVVKMESLLVLYGGGGCVVCMNCLKSDPVPIIGKDLSGSWTKHLSISEGSCYFFLVLLLLLFVILKVLRSKGLYHPWCIRSEHYNAMLTMVTFDIDCIGWVFVTLKCVCY